MAFKHAVVLSVFQDKIIPKGTRLCGLSYLVHSFQVQAPVRHPSVVSEQHVKGTRRVESDWNIFDKRYWPGDSLGEHLEFALRHENLDLLVLKRIFDAVPADALKDYVASIPTSVHARRAWYLYEFLTERNLDVPDAGNVGFTDLLDERLYFTAAPRLSRRHKVRDNLLGTWNFCPIIRKTEALEGFVARALKDRANEIIGRTGASVVARAASFLLLADSRASFEIEGEKPPRNRLERWGRAVLQAGKNPLTLEEILRLHAVLIQDTRFTKPGLRTDGVFLGERDHEGEPLPEFIGARPQDLPPLVQGLIAANERMSQAELDSVLQATATAFAFVYVHPFQDGNGRLHRCLIHHVLAERKFTPTGMVFPVSAVMLDRIERYRDTLRAHSGALMNFIEWRPTPQHNVEVLNDTADLYRYFDCTEQAEFLYACVARAIDKDLPMEIDFLRRNDEAKRRIMNLIEMPDQMVESLIRSIRLNGGKLGRKRRDGEFAQLTDDEVASTEAIVQDSFAGFGDQE
jgi:hypothetical protein